MTTHVPNVTAPAGERPSGWHRATAALFALAAGLTLAFGMLFMFSSRSVSVGAGAGPPDSDDIAIIAARGEAVELEQHTVEGKFTLFDFYADWCQQCLEISPYLEELARRNENVALRKINIVSWRTPVVKQFGLRFIPYLEMYGPDGEQLAKGLEPVLAELRERF